MWPWAIQIEDIKGDFLLPKSNKNKDIYQYFWSEKNTSNINPVPRGEHTS